MTTTTRSTGHVRLDPADHQGIARLTLSHPGKLNALNVRMWRELQALVAGLTAPGARPPRALIVCGEGGTFVAGGDIEEFPQFRFNADTLAAFHEEVVAPALQALLDCDVPLVAQIDGACVGGGLEIAACCDLRICGASSRFGVPIAKLGFPMAPLEVEIVARVIGETCLRELLLEARVLDAQEARARGLVTRIVPDAQVAAEALATAERIAALSPQAMRLNKRALRRFAAVGLPASARPEREAHYAYAPSDEHREGLAAFNERRPARFD
ncbi:enoyl-CoA hydratase/isomerase family protein [Ideonella livida]|uniref:Enoyl-CoA hydratase/isomerase family protein n=1 Tax=Ideonella livida TaxID=2707176 RepID=A0A7C9TP13_9BURK|nr:enoyl-CoA hydratase-related protein [Ideonella livida]NDY93927.1 enoyl-CoA hydratase/isomerase family protein [Ideonella livida]